MLQAWLETFWQRAAPLLDEILDALRQPIGLAVVLAVVATVALLVWWRRRAKRSLRGLLGDEQSHRSALRAARKSGNWREVGRRYAALGRNRAALEAYRRGGYCRESANLLLEMGKREQAKTEAREGEAWELYATLCEEDGDFAAAAEAFRLAQRAYAAGRCFEAAEQPLEAAQCYVEAEVDASAIRLLAKASGPRAAAILEQALRRSVLPERETIDADEIAAIRHCAQLWLEAGEAERAFRLVVDAGQWSLAVPIARHHLPASTTTIDACLRAEAHLVAAELYEQMGDELRAAEQRGIHYERQGHVAQAASWYEKAELWEQAGEQWAAHGDFARAAELYEKAQDFAQAAVLHGLAGDPIRQRQLSDLAEARSRQAMTDEGETIHEVAPPREPERGPTLPAGDDRYQLEEEVGRGGMGVVYRALDRVLARHVALKLLSSELARQARTADELLAEARAVARLSHPNIVQVYDAGRLGERFFLAMEWIEGETLAAVLNKRKLSLRGVIHAGRQICAALGHAHRRHIVHRDLKPSNLLWTPENQIKLTDFGLARVLEESLEQVLTRPAGTPYYMAPEQIRGDAIDGRADLYALGCVLFEMLCHRRPFAGGSSVYHHLNTAPEDPARLRQDVPPALAGLILSCLAKDPNERPASASAVGKALAEVTLA